jgi:hypothetical protein
MDKSIYVIKNTNKLYFDYPSFKTFASKENYPIIVNHFIQTIQKILTIFPTFEIHINLFSFNTSSLAKHQEFLRIFAGYSNLFGNKLTDFYIYHTPSIMDSIFKIISTHIFYHKDSSPPNFILYKKNESADKLQALI